MKVMQVNCVYDEGSTGKIVSELRRYLLSRQKECVICYGRGKRTTDADVYKLSREWEAKLHSAMARLFGGELSYSFLATWRLIHLIRKERPDVVHLHCLNGHFLNVYQTLRFLKKHRIPTVLTLHAEIMHTGGCQHAMECEQWKEGCRRCDKVNAIVSSLVTDVPRTAYERMQRAMKGFDTLMVVGVSEWLTARASQSAIMRGLPCMTIPNGIDTKVFRPMPCHALLPKAAPPGRKLVLHVTPDFSNPLKGGQTVLELASRMPDVMFMIVGFNGNADALPNNVIPIGWLQESHILAQYYSLADVLVSASLCESYPTVCLEAVCCGTPVVAFDVGGTKEAIPDGLGETVTSGDLDGMEQALRKWMEIKPDAQTVEAARLKHDSARMATAYEKLYKHMRKAAKV